MTAAALVPTISGNPTVNEDDNYTLNLAVSNPDQQTINGWDINWGDGTPDTLIDGNASSAAHVFANAGTYQVAASVSDNTGIYYATPLTVTANLVPPTVTINGPTTVNEDSTYTLDMSATGEPVNHPITGWTIDWGDGTEEQQYADNPPSEIHVYARAGSYQIRAWASEDEGTFPAMPLTVTAQLVQPTVTISGDSAVAEDATYTLNLSATGTVPDHPILSWTINWGDNTPPDSVPNDPSTAPHVYTSPGQYQITALANTDESQFSAAAPVNVNVLVVAPAVTISGNSTVNEDATYTLNLSATGADPNHPVTTWTVNWGDGTGNHTIQGNPSTTPYVYPDAGSYAITAWANTDQGQFSAAQTVDVNVAIVSPTVSISGNSTVDEDDTYTLNLSATGTVPDHPIMGWVINWGDGSPNIPESGTATTATHVYKYATLSNPPYQVTATASTDEKAFSAAAAVDVTALLVQPDVTISGNSNVNEGAVYTLSLSATGAVPDHPIENWSINWGDGTTDGPLSGNLTSYTHVYLNSGTYSITATATTNEWGFPSNTISVTAAVQPPTVTISGASSVNEDDTYTLNYSATGAAGPSGDELEHLLGDGTSSLNVSPAQTSITHVYKNATLNNPPYQINATANNDQGNYPATALMSTCCWSLPPSRSAGPARSMRTRPIR